MKTVTRLITGPLVKVVRRVLNLKRTRGNARAFYAIARKFTTLPVIRNLVRFSAIDLWQVSLSEQKPIRRVPKNFTVRKAQADDLPALVEYFGGTFVEDRFRRGDHCWITVCQDQIGAALWISIGPGQFDEDWQEMRCRFGFPETVGWTYDGKGTRLGAWGMLMAQLPGQLRPLGIEELYTVIDCNNWQSTDAHRSLGYQHVGVVARIGVLGLAMTRCRAGGRWRQLPQPIGRLEIE